MAQLLGGHLGERQPRPGPLGGVGVAELVDPQREQLQEAVAGPGPGVVDEQVEPEQQLVRQVALDAHVRGCGPSTP